MNSKYTNQPVFTPFPATGSLFFRMGVYYNRPMTAQEQRFEHFVNERQASHDIFVEKEEWKRCRDIENKAVQIYDDTNGVMGQYR